MFYLSNIYKILSFPKGINIKHYTCILLGFYYLFKIQHDFPFIVYLNSDGQFSSEILDLFNRVKLQLRMQNHVVQDFPNILKIFK